MHRRFLLLSIVRSLFCLFLLMALPSPLLFAAEVSPNSEIEGLIHFVESSDVRFIRNGTEYGPKEAGDHLRQKLSKAGGQVKTAEDFITGIASKSYLSGKPYLVKFPDGHTELTDDWLKAQLVEIRKSER